MRPLWRGHLAAVSLAAAALPGLTLTGAALADELPATGTISGHFLDHGVPLSNAYIVLYQGANNAGYAFTDATGAYQLSDVPAGIYTLQFNTPYNPDAPPAEPTQQIWYHQKTAQADADPITVTAGTTTVLDEQTLPTGALTVRAIDAVTHRPQRQFCAEANKASLPAVTARHCTTDGIVTLTGLLPGSYTVTVEGDPLHTTAQSLPATVVANRTARLRAALPQAAAITTTVVDATTRAPVADICLSAVATTSGGNRFTAGGTHVPGVLGGCSDENGKVQLGKLAAGDYQLFALPTAAGYGAQWVGPKGGTGQRSAAKLVHVKLGKAIAAPQVRVGPAGTITGTLTDTAGAPARSVCALPYASAAAFFSGTACTDAAGHYTLTGLGSYKWPVEFVNRTGEFAWQWSGGAPNSAAAALTQVTGGATATLDASLAAGHTITGHITLLAGTSATIYAYSAVTGEYAARYAPVADGTYTLTGLAPQTVKISVVVTSTTPQTTTWYGGTTFATAAPVTVPATGDVTGIDLLIP